jgi:hypothetical protein
MNITKCGFCLEPLKNMKCKTYMCPVENAGYFDADVYKNNFVFMVYIGMYIYKELSTPLKNIYNYRGYDKNRDLLYSIVQKPKMYCTATFKPKKKKK